MKDSLLQTDCRILGIDTGLLRTGYAIVAGAGRGRGRLELVEAGVIRLAPRTALEARLVELDRALDSLFAAHGPALLACEALYAHYKHPRTAILMGHARGVILASAGRRNLPVVNVPATQIKKMITGNGRAGKSQIQRAVAATLGLATLPEPHDVADAIAIAVTGLRLRDGEVALGKGHRAAPFGLGAIPNLERVGRVLGDADSVRGLEAMHMRPAVETE